MRDAPKGGGGPGRIPGYDPRFPEKGSQDLGSGLQFGIAIVAFTLLGAWADRKLNTSPLFLLAGMFLGAGGGFYAMYRRLVQSEKKGAGGKGPDDDSGAAGTRGGGGQ